VGIDFGTTNSLVACAVDLLGGAPDIVIAPDRRGGRVTPSVVGVSQTGFLVGEPAKNQALANVEGTLFLVKRLLGERQTVGLAGKEYRVIDLAGRIFSELKSRADAFLGVDSKAAVITVPARFSSLKRETVIDAARIGGFDEVRLLNEPTAAAIAYASAAKRRGATLRGRGESTYVVYDFGGGTFDVTVLTSGPDGFRVLWSDGDERLGGVDVDAALADLAARRMKSELGIDARGDPVLSRMLDDQAEKAKMDLSAVERAGVSLPFARSGGIMAHFEMTVSRAELERIAAPTVERTVALVRKALDKAGISPQDVDELVLSGGMSRMPLVRVSLERQFGWSVAPMVDPEEIVAIGAGTYASTLKEDARKGRLVSFGVSGESQGATLNPQRVRDVASESYGIELADGSVGVVVRRGEPIPVVKSRVFTTVDDGQRSVEIHILQGSASRADECDSLGRFMLSGIPSAPKGAPEIVVSFEIDESDLLTVSARDSAGATGKVITVERASAGSGGMEGARAALEALLRRFEAQCGGSGALTLHVEVAEATRAGESALRSGSLADMERASSELRALAAELSYRSWGG
jgi:molecular chaperone DnaK